MTICLRTSDNKTLVDIEIYDKDLSSVVDIKNYSEMLWDVIDTLQGHRDVVHADNLIKEIINIFDSLQELRGWLHETYISTVNKNPTRQDIEKEVRNILENVATKYNLKIVTD